MMEIQGRWRTIASVLAVVVLVAVVTPFAVYAVPQLVGAEESYVVLSGSMEPTLTAGDVVIVDADATIAVGDIVTYAASADSIPTTHRVVETTEAGFITKGDANENADPGLLTSDSIIGEVVVVIPLIGHVILWTNTPVGLVFLVVIPVTALVLNELRRWSARGERSNPDRTAREFTDEDGIVLNWAVPKAETVEPVEGVAIGMIDLKMTLGAMGVVFVYAAWNVAREIMAVSAPHPISVGVMTAGLLGLVLAGWITISTWLATRRERTVAEASMATRTDGSGTIEETNE
ncbi:MAG: signal peptidase I [Halanaeroarchaeum sp.]